MKHKIIGTVGSIALLTTIISMAFVGGVNADVVENESELRTVLEDSGVNQTTLYLNQSTYNYTGTNNITVQGDEITLDVSGNGSSVDCANVSCVDSATINITDMTFDTSGVNNFTTTSNVTFVDNTTNDATDAGGTLIGDDFFNDFSDKDIMIIGISLAIIGAVIVIAREEDYS